jgi:hypothetical protein
MLNYFISNFFFFKIFKYSIFKNIYFSNLILNISFILLCSFYISSIEKDDLNFMFVYIFLISSLLFLILFKFIKKDYSYIEDNNIKLFSLFSIFNFFLIFFNIFISILFYLNNIDANYYLLIYLLSLVVYFYVNIFSIIRKHEKISIFKIKFEYNLTKIEKINLDFNYFFKNTNLFIHKNSIYFYLNNLKFQIYGNQPINISISNKNGFICRYELNNLIKILSDYDINFSELNEGYLKLISISEY